VRFAVTFELLNESSDGETLIAVGIWFQICGAFEEKPRRPTSVLYWEHVGYRRDWLEVNNWIGGYAGSTPGRGAIKSTRSTQPSIPPESSTGLYGWG